MGTDRDQSTVSDRRIHQKPEARQAAPLAPDTMAPDAMAPTSANLLHLQRTAGNSALANSIARIQASQKAPGVTAQRIVTGPDGNPLTPTEVFKFLNVTTNDEWQLAAARSIVDDHIVHKLANTRQR